jgi:putative GTP pyrophosphokinase
VIPASLAACRDTQSALGKGEELWSAEMAFAVPQFSRNQVDKAGFVLVNPNCPFEEYISALQVINNWRSSHNFPLNNFTTNLRIKVKTIQSDVLVAQRIKRLESIEAKLTRDQTQTMQLSQMQDIGGCRAIVNTIANVRKLVASYHSSRFNHKLLYERDYIKTLNRTAIGAIT